MYKDLIALYGESIKNNAYKPKLIVEKQKPKQSKARINRIERESNLPCTLTKKEWTAIKKSFRYRCCYCGNKKPLQKEHFIPVVKGGGTTKENILPACWECNRSKNSRSFYEWYPSYKHYSDKKEHKILAYISKQIKTTAR